jgi:Zn-dependent protease with chaperone function
MRIPFDLIAALLVIAVIDQLNPNPNSDSESLKHVCAAIPYWIGFWGITWLLNEWVTRKVEWLTRFGRRMTPEPGRRHPVEIHSWLVIAAQAVMVAMFGFVLWKVQWPQLMKNWPQWMGITGTLGELNLSQSTIVGMFLNLAPFLIAMLLAWCPRWRLMCGSRRRRIPLLTYLNFEARLTWLPLVGWLLLSVLVDIGHALPEGYTSWLHAPGVEVLLSVTAMAALAAIGLPLFMVTFWDCSPLPDGELKDRLTKLLDKSGVKVRKIMVWGRRDTGMLNACVMGPWSRFRYVLISPALTDELGMDETEAVLAHELGHARHGHLTLLFVMLLCMSAMLDPLDYFFLPDSWRASPVIESAAAFVFIVVFIRLVFGSVMRICEREADLTSAELVGSPVPIIMALEKLALRSGNIRSVYSWHHGSIADRVASVLKLSSDPIGGARVHKQIRLVRLALGILAVLAVGAQLLVHGS